MLPTPQIELSVQQCLDDVISLVMRRHYTKQLVDARKKKKRNEKSEREEVKKKNPFLGGKK
jgi:hypothetical protein